MAERKSLMDDPSMSKIGAKGSQGGAKSKKKGGGGTSAETKKIMLAAGILVLAGGWLGYYYVIKPGMEQKKAQAQTKPLTAEEQQAFQEQEAEREKAEKDPKIIKGGA